MSGERVPVYVEFPAEPDVAVVYTWQVARGRSVLCWIKESGKWTTSVPQTSRVISRSWRSLVLDHPRVYTRDPRTIPGEEPA